ncbi:hypothetical protein FKM82_026941 [Ascaphus truei]
MCECPRRRDTETEAQGSGRRISPTACPYRSSPAHTAPPHTPTPPNPPYRRTPGIRPPQPPPPSLLHIPPSLLSISLPIPPPFSPPHPPSFLSTSPHLSLHPPSSPSIPPPLFFLLAAAGPCYRNTKPAHQRTRTRQWRPQRAKLKRQGLPHLPRRATRKR